MTTGALPEHSRSEEYALIPGAGKKGADQGVGSNDALDHVPDVTKVITEQASRRQEAISRRREIRALQRQQLNEARQYGLRARHAAKLKGQS